MALFGFCGSCAGLQSWLEEQTALLHTLQPQADSLQAVQHQLEVQPLPPTLEPEGNFSGLAHCLSFLSALPTPPSPCSCLWVIRPVNYSPVWEEGSAFEFF